MSACQPSGPAGRWLPRSPPWEALGLRLPAIPRGAQFGHKLLQGAELTEVSRLGRGEGDNTLKMLRRRLEGRHYRGSAAAAWAAVILGGGWSGSLSLRRFRSSVSSGSGWV